MDVCHDLAPLLVKDERTVAKLAPIAHRFDSIPARWQGLEDNIKAAAESGGALPGLVKWQTELAALSAVEPELPAKAEPLHTRLAEVGAEIVRKGMDIEQIEHAIRDLRWRAYTIPSATVNLSRPTTLKPCSGSVGQRFRRRGPHVGSGVWRNRGRRALRRQGVLPA